ncbi:MAG: hypothetical protein WCO60_18915 [Verrucomicrobiota bacterium]
MKPVLDQFLVFATVGVAICYFILKAIRARRNSGKCLGGCGCSLGSKSKLPNAMPLVGIDKTPLGGLPGTAEDQNTKARGV